MCSVESRFCGDSVILHMSRIAANRFAAKAQLHQASKIGFSKVGPKFWVQLSIPQKSWAPSKTR